MPETNLLGIENLKKAGKFAVQLGMQVEETAQDGFKLIEVFDFVNELAQLPAIVNSKDAIVAEFKDLTTAEKQELIAYIENELVLSNKVVEERIEAGLELLLSVLVFLDKIKKPAVEPPAPTP